MEKILAQPEITKAKRNNYLSNVTKNVNSKTSSISTQKTPACNRLKSAIPKGPSENEIKALEAEKMIYDLVDKN